MQNQTEFEVETAQEPVEPSRQLADSVDEEDFDYGPPRGTVAFLALMLIGYIIYYAIHYIEIFVLR
ncbi:MAG: hypothetical protein AAF846_04750 [Chloroflexota bacterium]